MITSAAFKIKFLLFIIYHIGEIVRNSAEGPVEADSLSVVKYRISIALP